MHLQNTRSNQILTKQNCFFTWFDELKLKKSLSIFDWFECRCRFETVFVFYDVYARPLTKYTQRISNGWRKGRGMVVGVCGGGAWPFLSKIYLVEISGLWEIWHWVQNTYVSDRPFHPIFNESSVHFCWNVRFHTSTRLI